MSADILGCHTSEEKGSYGHPGGRGTLRRGPLTEVSGLQFSGAEGGTLWGGNLEQYEEARSTVTVS